MNTNSFPQKHYDVVELLSKSIIWGFIPLVYGIVRIIKLGFDWQGIALIDGFLLSIIGYFFYSIATSRYHRDKRKTWGRGLLTFTGLLPYLYGCFLVFYKGFYGFKYLFDGVTIWEAIVPVLWIIIGYRIVNYTYLITKLAKKDYV